MLLVEWNLHKMTNNVLVEKYVIDCLKRVEADIICLVEYLTDSGIEEAFREDYFLAESNSCSGNKVFIAIKKSISSDEIRIIKRDGVIDCYSFLHIDFSLSNGEIFSVIGIRMLSPIDAPKQTPSLYKYLKRIENTFICVGDYNIKDYRMEHWFPTISIETIEKDNKPLGDTSIIYVDKKTKEIVGYGAVDHALHSKDIEIKTKYDWDFLSKCMVYPSIEKIKPGEIWDIPAAYPDHAMMISIVEITKNDKE